jgi:hypothetical protein
VSTPRHTADNDALTMALALAYYVPLGWALDDGEEVDPEDLAECLKAMSPVASVVRERLAEAWDAGFNSDYEGDGWPPNPYGDTCPIPSGVGE